MVFTVSEDTLYENQSVFSPDGPPEDIRGHIYVSMMDKVEEEEEERGREGWKKNMEEREKKKKGK